MKKNPNTKLGLVALLTIVLAYLKSKGIVDLSWAWVFAPIAIFFVSTTIMFIKLFIKELNNTNSKKRR